jgi:site-specific DNA-methyltransferase (adenine-specific)
MEDASNFSDGELAFTSFPRALKSIRMHQFTGTHGGKDRIHPTQKPVALYKWLLTNYAKKGDKILDTHGGSMSIAIACHDLGFDLDLYEIDKDYFEAGKLRLERHQQQQMFEFNG